MKDLSLYIHIPFCAQKCYYCDFLSFSSAEENVNAYFEALYKEVEKTSSITKDYNVKTIFIGGGTPTYVASKYIIHLLEIINEKFVIDPHAEISIESNPATFDKLKLKDYLNVGINRLSIGLQCWQDDLLKRIGRVHTRKQFVHAYLVAKDMGFKNINVDLIFALPDQTFEHWKQTLDEVCKLDPNHLSCYSLKLEEGTPLFNQSKEKEIFLNDDLDRQMYHYTVDVLKANGYNHYEVSNFSKPELECKHNLVYWELGDYIGLGLGAHSYFNGYRYKNEENLKTYIDKIRNGKPIKEDNTLLSKEHKKEEFIFLGLRKINGIEVDSYQRFFHEELFADFGEEIQKLKKNDYIIFDKGNIRLSKKGLDFANYVFMSFIK